MEEKKNGIIYDLNSLLKKHSNILPYYEEVYSPVYLVISLWTALLSPAFNTYMWPFLSTYKLCLKVIISFLLQG